MENKRIYKGTVCISDAEFRYAYLIEAHVTAQDNVQYIDYVRFYFPEFSPEAYDKHPKYFLNITRFEGHREIPLVLTSFDRSDALACSPITNDRNTYYEYIDFCCHKPLPSIDRLYVSLTPVIISGGKVRVDMEYNSGQSALVKNTSDVAAKFAFDGNDINLVPALSGNEFILSNDYLSSIYGEGKYFIQYHVFLAGAGKIYEAIESDIYPVNDAPKTAAKIKEDIMQQFSNKDNDDTSHERWEPGLRLAGTIVIYKSTTNIGAEHIDECLELVSIGDNKYKINSDSDQSDKLRSDERINVVKFAGFMTDPLPITQELYAQWCYGSNEIIEFVEDMKIIQPRIINKTVNKVYEITSRTDPHANIIQPVFFKVRDLASIVVHPDVTENICINLDAYKSQCATFMLKIEGTTFVEIARVEAGVVFKIRSNMLPGKVDSGIYYILNQDAELVTTGKYYYER